MIQGTVRPENLSTTSGTLLMTLYARVLESQRPDGLIHDPQAVALYECMDVDFSRYRMDAHDQLAVALRMRKLDDCARAFLSEHPGGVAVHIGCGLDTRFDRVNNGQVEWYDLNLPPVIALRRRLLVEKPWCHILRRSRGQAPGAGPAGTVSRRGVGI